MWFPVHFFDLYVPRRCLSMLVLFYLMPDVWQGPQHHRPPPPLPYSHAPAYRSENTPIYQPLVALSSHKLELAHVTESCQLKTAIVVTVTQPIIGTSMQTWRHLARKWGCCVVWMWIIPDNSLVSFSHHIANVASSRFVLADIIYQICKFVYEQIVANIPIAYKIDVKWRSRIGINQYIDLFVCWHYLRWTVCLSVYLSAYPPSL